MVIFLAGNNHLSNVQTLQSIYRQDCPHIRLVICNDATYGFDNERLLNNFEEKRNSNIEQVIFQENPTAIGEYGSQQSLWGKFCDDYVITIHAGEVFKSSSFLRNCVQRLESNPLASALISDCEFWNKNYASIKLRLSAGAIVSDIKNSLMTDSLCNQEYTVYDCMVIYRLSVLSDMNLQIDDQQTHISRFVIPWLLAHDKHVIVSDVCLCTFSENSIDPMIKAYPDDYGNQSLKHISQLLSEERQKTDSKTNVLQIAVGENKKNSSKRLLLILYKLSTVSRVLMYAGLTLLLFIASGLFLNLKTEIFTWIGVLFFICAGLSVFWTMGMLAVNLYLKKNPQRLVM